MKLYEINEEIDRLTDTIYVDEETGEVVGDVAAICKEIETLQMEKKKVLEYLAKVVLNTRAESAAIKAEEERLKARRDRLDKKAERVLAVIDRECGEKTDLGVATLSYHSSTAVEVSDNKKAVYWLMINGHMNCCNMQEPKVAKTAVKELIKSGIEVPCCKIVENRNCSLK